MKYTEIAHGAPSYSSEGLQKGTVTAVDYGRVTIQGKVELWKTNILYLNDRTEEGKRVEGCVHVEPIIMVTWLFYG